MTTEQLVDRYCEAWSAPTAHEREALIRATLSGDAVYCDPRTGPLPVAGLLEHIARLHQARQGARVARTSVVDQHHGMARFAWQAVMPDGQVLTQGVDFVELTADRQRMRRVIGFFGPLTACR
jgi:hypothetical protein